MDGFRDSIHKAETQTKFMGLNVKEGKLILWRRGKITIFNKGVDKINYYYFFTNCPLHHPLKSMPD